MFMRSNRHLRLVASNDAGENGQRGPWRDRVKKAMRGMASDLADAAGEYFTDFIAMVGVMLWNFARLMVFLAVMVFLRLPLVLLRTYVAPLCIFVGLIYWALMGFGWPAKVVLVCWGVGFGIFVVSWLVDSLCLWLAPNF